MTDKLDNSEAILYRAAEIKQQLKLLEAEYEMLEPQVIARIKELSRDKDKYALQVGNLGTFSIVKKPKWEYSPAAQTLEIKLKEQKKTEEADGTAKIINYTEYPQFRSLNTNGT